MRTISDVESILLSLCLGYIYVFLRDDREEEEYRPENGLPT